MLAKRYSIPEALQKAKHYCAYQERSHYETRTKLYSFGLFKQEVETLLSQLIEENYLNEERFALQFASGKFKLKQWGKIKIKYELGLKKVSAYNIKKALNSIDETQYNKTLQVLAAKKWKSLSNETLIQRKGKTQNYLLQKGYEIAGIQAAIHVLSLIDK